MLGGTETRMTTRIGDAEARLKAETSVVRSALESKMDGVVATVDDLKSKVDNQESRLVTLEDKLARMSGEVAGSGGRGEGEECEDEPEIVTKAWGSPGPKSYAAALGRPMIVAKRSRIDPEKKREEDYWRCRKALRLRPVADGEDRLALETYLTENLKLSSSSLTVLGLDRAKMERVPYGPKSKFQKEMIVYFPTTEARDVVRGSARNLANHDHTYGVRLELPNHLKSTMQALQSVSYELKQKHPQAKRNVLFDDGCQDLVLDFTTGDGKPWRRISSKQAKAAKKKRAGLDTGKHLQDSELDSILGRPEAEQGAGRPPVWRASPEESVDEEDLDE